MSPGYKCCTTEMAKTNRKIKIEDSTIHLIVSFARVWALLTTLNMN